MREWHGLDLLVDAIAALPELRLLIIGDGPARRAVEQHASARGVRDRLAITGRVPSASMPEHLAAVDIAVVANDGTAVASPMKLLEYMAMERAVVAPRLDNISDLVTNGRDGLLFTPGDTNDLVRHLRQLATDDALRERLGREARRTILNTRNWRANAERVLALVEQRVAASPRYARLAHRSL
jgi:glycosyltransferase involved in cell wall biosynthesis